MIKKLAVISLALSCVSANAIDLKTDNLDQKKLFKKAQLFEKKTLTTQACKLYQESFALGYQGKKGQESNPRENKNYVQSALMTSECLTDSKLTDNPQDWLKGVVVLFQLKNSYHVQGIPERLELIQSDMFEKSQIIKDATNYHFASPNDDLRKACAAAEIGYRIGYLGSPEFAKDPDHNDKFVKSGIYHAICVSLLPSKSQNQQDLSNLASFTILKELSAKYNSTEAKQITAPSEAILNVARRQSKQDHSETLNTPHIEATVNAEQPVDQVSPETPTEKTKKIPLFTKIKQWANTPPESK